MCLYISNYIKASWKNAENGQFSKEKRIERKKKIILKYPQLLYL
jgi:hypothetical protein